MKKFLSVLLIVLILGSFLSVSSFATQYTAWSNWSTTPAYASSTRQVETRQVVASYNLEGNCCGNAQGYRCYLKYMQSGYTLRLHYPMITVSKSELDTWDRWAQGSYYTYAPNVNGYIIGPGTGYITPWDRVPYFIVGTNYETQYRYRDIRVDMNSCNITLSNSLYTYDGTRKEPAITVKYGSNILRKGVDYTCSFSNNVNVGTAMVYINGIGNYCGQTLRYFQIQEVPKKNINDCVILLSESSMTYDGKQKTPVVTVMDNNAKLSEGTDYTVSYANNVNIGTASVTVSGIGRYTGTKTLDYKITLESTSFTRLSADVSAAIILQWKQANGIDGYQIQYADNTTFKKAKTFTANASSENGKLSTGLKNKTTYSFRIRTYKKIGDKTYYSEWNTGTLKFIYPKTISLACAKYVYSNKVFSPKVTVKDSAGKTIDNKYYKVTYEEGRKQVGRYSVTVTFSGKYSGKITGYFDIVPKSTEIVSVSKPAKAQFGIKWNKVSDISGYQIQTASLYNFSKSLKTYTAKSTSTNALFKTGIKSKQIYFMRIRTFKTVKYAGKNLTLYSSWSKVKSVKTK